MNYLSKLNTKLIVLAVASVFLVACKSTPIAPAKVKAQRLLQKLGQIRVLILALLKKLRLIAMPIQVAIVY